MAGAEKAELKKAQGNAYFSNLLDKLNIEQGVANRAMMADYLDPKRFPWVFFADSFMWPFDNQRERARNRDQEVYIPLQEKMLHRWMQQENVDKLPPDFAGYLAFISRVLEDNQKKGGIAMKFEVAYFRSTRFGDPTREQAEDVYRRFVSGGFPAKRSTGHFRITSSVSWCGRAEGCTCPSTYIRPWHRRLLQPLRRQYPESGEYSPRPAIFQHRLCDDSRRLSLRAPGDLAGGN